MMLNTGCRQNVGGKVCFDCFIDTFNGNILDKVIRCPEGQQFKLRGAIILKASFCVEIPVVLTRENLKIKFGVANNEHLLTLEKKNTHEFKNIIY